MGTLLNYVIRIIKRLFIIGVRVGACDYDAWIHRERPEVIYWLLWVPAFRLGARMLSVLVMVGGYLLN